MISFFLRNQCLSEKTLRTYKEHLTSIGKHLPIDNSMDSIEQKDLERMISSMRDVGLSANSIQSYTRTLKSFFSWCKEEGIANLSLSRYRAEETIKDTYSDAELKLLLKKPNMRKCSFSEYRNWVTINLLLNNGCRAASVRNIMNKDVDLNNQVIYRQQTQEGDIMAIEHNNMGGRSQNQKFKSMLVAQVLLKRTDDDHAISTEEIIKYLEEYGVSAEAHSIQRDIRLLNRIFEIDMLRQTCCKGTLL